MNLKDIMLKAVTKGQVLHDSTYLTYVKQNNYKHAEQISDCRG